MSANIPIQEPYPAIEIPDQPFSVPAKLGDFIQVDVSASELPEVEFEIFEGARMFADEV